MPPLLLLGLVLAWGVDVPFWDQWDFVPEVTSLFDGRPDVDRLWRGHLGHRMALPKAVMLLAISS